MNYKMLFKFISIIMALEAAFMLPALIIALRYGEVDAITGFAITIAAMVVVALVMFLITRKDKGVFHAKDGLVCVGLSWIFLSLFGAVPFIISGAIPSFIDALFETVSGFTTTGATILNEIESLPMSILYWRSFTHWLGGMGVLVFMLAITNGSDRSKGFTMHLLRAESPGPSVEKLVPKMKTTAEILYLMYIVLTVLDFIFLKFGKMSTFEAVTTALGTAGTGGFAVKNDSLASYSSYIQNVTTVFMLLFGVNFSCYFLLVMGKVKAVLKDQELRTYLLIVFGSIAVIAINIRGFYDTVGETLKHTAFQVAATISSTGFMTADFDQWPNFSKGILLVLMLVGACAGSTGGGFKVARMMLVFKTLKRNLRELVHPGKVGVVRINDRVVDEKVLNNTTTYFGVYVILIILSFIFLSANGFSVATNISAVISCVNNIGPGFDVVGPTCSYSSFTWFSKLVLIFDMLAGRLELFPIIMLFSKSTWKSA